jgi:hypothetical protein
MFCLNTFPNPFDIHAFIQAFQSGKHIQDYDTASQLVEVKSYETFVLLTDLLNVFLLLLPSLNSGII